MLCCISGADAVDGSNMPPAHVLEQPVLAMLVVPAETRAAFMAEYRVVRAAPEREVGDAHGNCIRRADDRAFGQLAHDHCPGKRLLPVWYGLRLYVCKLHDARVGANIREQTPETRASMMITNKRDDYSITMMMIVVSFTAYR